MISKRIVTDHESFWAKQAESLFWFRKWDKVLEWKKPFAKWFVGGKLNASSQCVDVHVQTWRKNKVAIHWEDENGTTVSLSYAQLYREINRCASVLKNLGVKKGDRVVLYMPLVPEVLIFMLATARLGAVHSVVFSGFGSKALADRINDAGASLVVTSDVTFRRGKKIYLKKLMRGMLFFIKIID